MSHTYCQLYYHLVWSTKERQPIIKNEFKGDLYKYLGGAVRGKEGRLLEIGGVADHVHLLVALSSRFSIAEVVQQIKIGSSKWVSQNFFKQGSFAWQEGYGAFSVSESIRTQVTQYIQNQEQHHLNCSFREEFLNLLRRYNVEFDEKYLWK